MTPAGEAPEKFPSPMLVQQITGQDAAKVRELEVQVCSILQGNTGLRLPGEAWEPYRHVQGQGQDSLGCHAWHKWVLCISKLLLCT